MNVLKNLLFAFVVSFSSNTDALDYLIGPGDIIEINVFQQPDMKAVKTVSANGEVSFPIVGLVKVQGMTEHQAESEISRRLKNSRIINSPEVAVRIVEYRSATIAIEGLVAKPGEYPVIGKLSIHQLVSKAGGLKEDASPIVTVYRNGQPPRNIDLLEIYRSNSTSGDASIRAGDRVLVEPEADPAVFYTYGAVTKNGRYELTEGMTIMQALALSGGRTDAATKTRVKIFRAKEGGGLLEIDASEEDFVQPNDVIRIEESRF